MVFKAPKPLRKNHGSRAISPKTLRKKTISRGGTDSEICRIRPDMAAKKAQAMIMNTVACRFCGRRDINMAGRENMEEAVIKAF